MAETLYSKEISAKSIVQLPPELITIILRHALAGDPTLYLTHLGNGDPEKLAISSARERLKPLRLEGRVFCDAVTPAVFASIHMHASSLSVARAESIANSRLAIHVEEIVHHQGTFTGHDGDRQLFLRTLNSHMRRQDYPKELITANRHRYYEHFLEEIGAANQFDKAGDFQKYAFQSLVNKLPNCKTFVSLPYHDEWHDPETSSYILKRTGLSYLPMPGFTNYPEAYRFTSAITVLKPRKLNVALFPIDAIHALTHPVTVFPPTPSSDSSDELLWAKDRFGQLKELKLGPAYGAKYGYHSEHWSHDTTLLLRASENLVSLELTNDYPLNRQFAVPPKDGLPHLQTLTISKGITLGHWPAASLVECIRNVGATLQHLHFDGVVLKNWLHRAGGGTDAMHDLMGAPNHSLISLLHDVTAATSLRSCTGLETVEDVKSEVARKGSYRRSGPKPGKNALVKKLEQAVCHRRQWPPNLPIPSIFGSNPLTVGYREPSGLDAATAFIYAHWDETIDEFELADEH